MLVKKKKIDPNVEAEKMVGMFDSFLDKTEDIEFKVVNFYRWPDGHMDATCQITKSKIRQAIGIIFDERVDSIAKKIEEKTIVKLG
jgi:hypothetical protein